VEVTKSDIIKLIEIEKRNTFINHFLTIIQDKNYFQGEIKSNKIFLWRQHFWNKTFYPVFTFELNSKNHLVNIRHRINPVGGIFYFVFVLSVLALFMPSGFSDIDWEIYYPVFLFGVILISLLALLITKIYRFEKKQQLHEIFDLLDIEYEKDTPEKEWSVKNIVIRLFTYPFCLFLIGLNIFLLIPNNDIMLALCSLGFVGFYIISDLKMIFRIKR